MVQANLWANARFGMGDNWALPANPMPSPDFSPIAKKKAVSRMILWYLNGETKALR